MQIEFTKNDEDFKNKIFAEPWLNLEKIEFDDLNIYELLDIQHDHNRSQNIWDNLVFM